MAAPLILYLDSTRKMLLSNFLTTVGLGATPQLEAGDNVPLQLHFLQQNTASQTPGAIPYFYIDPASVLPVSLAIGTIGLVPTAGTFIATFGANSTGAIAFNATSTAVSTALNLLASIIAAGGVSVTGAAGGPWTVIFTTSGAQSLLTINAGELVPVSQGLVGRSVTGATGVQEQQVITLLQNPAALQNAWTATYGTATVAELQLGAAGVNEIQRVSIPVSSYGGSFSLTFGGKATGPLAYNATAAAVQTALQALSSIGANNASVTQSSTGTWDVTFIGGLGGAPQALLTANSAGLMAPMYLSGTLNLNVQGILNLLAGAASVSATLQIQQGNSGAINTVLQTPVTINASLIEGSPGVPPAVAVYQSGQIVIVPGTQSYALVFPTALPTAPSFIGTQFCLSGAGGEFITAEPDYSTLTNAGVTIRLSANPTGASTGAFIKWLIFP